MKKYKFNDVEVLISKKNDEKENNVYDESQQKPINKKDFFDDWQGVELSIDFEKELKDVLDELDVIRDDHFIKIWDEIDKLKFKPRNKNIDPSLKFIYANDFELPFGSGFIFDFCYGKYNIFAKAISLIDYNTGTFKFKYIIFDDENDKINKNI